MGLAVLLAACADESPTRPTTTPVPRAPPSAFPSGSVLQVVSGETGIPVAAATITVGSSKLTTDGAGQASLVSDFGTGTLVDIEDDAFLPRQTRLLEATGTRFTLIPRRSGSGLTEDFVRDVLYHPSSGSDDRYMMRIPPGTETAYVAPSEQIRNDIRAMRAVNDALDELNAMVQGEIRFAVTADAPVSAVSFGLVIDPNDPHLGDGAIAVARRRLSGWNIVGGTVVYDSIETARTSATHHELGHMVGLGHSGATSDVMYPYLHRRVETFSTRERVGVRLILQRPALNRYPDNDRDVRNPQSSRDGSVTVVVCYR